MTVRDRIVFAGGLAVAVILATLVDQHRAAAQAGVVPVTIQSPLPVPVVAQRSRLTHMDRRVDEHVVLSNLPGPGVQSFSRVFLNGSRDPALFQVPPGQFLVVTDVEWSVNMFSLLTTDFGATLALRTLPQVAGNDFVYQSSLIVPAGQRSVVRNDYMTSGFVVGAGRGLGVSAVSLFSAQAQTGRVIVRGYLIL